MAGQTSTVCFDDEAIAIIDRIRSRYRNSDVQVDEVLRDALGLYAWAAKEVSRGGTIAVLHGDVPVDEVILPFRKR